MPEVTLSSGEIKSVQKRKVETLKRVEKDPETGELFYPGNNRPVTKAEDIELLRAIKPELFNGASPPTEGAIKEDVASATEEKVDAMPDNSCASKSDLRATEDRLGAKIDSLTNLVKTRVIGAAPVSPPATPTSPPATSPPPPISGDDAGGGPVAVIAGAAADVKDKVVETAHEIKAKVTGDGATASDGASGSSPVVVENGTTVTLDEASLNRLADTLDGRIDRKLDERGLTEERFREIAGEVVDQKIAATNDAQQLPWRVWLRRDALLDATSLFFAVAAVVFAAMYILPWLGWVDVSKISLLPPPPDWGDRLKIALVFGLLAGITQLAAEATRRGGEEVIVR